METLAVVAWITAIGSAASAGVSLWSLRKDPRPFEALRASLEKLESTQARDVMDQRSELRARSEKATKHLAFWVDAGVTIAVAVQERVKARMIRLAQGTVAIVGAMYVDFPNYLMSEPDGRIEVHDFSLAVLPLLFRLFADRVITTEERRFLKNLANLQEHYHKVVIGRAMTTFLHESSTVFGAIVDVVGQQEAETREILEQYLRHDSSTET